MSQHQLIKTYFRYLSDSWADVEKHFSGDSWSSQGNNVYGCIKQLFLLKKNNCHLKTLLFIGGWTYLANFVKPASTDAGRNRFAQTATQLLLDFGFDGLDIDWEYPKDKNEGRDFVKLLKVIWEFLLTAAVSAGQEHYRQRQLKNITPYLDFYSLMCYDYAGKWSTVAGHQANLKPSRKNPKSTPFSTEAALNYYIREGQVSPSKILLSMPLYGRAFADTDGLGAPFQGSGNEGSWEAGIWDYKVLPQPGATEQMDSSLTQDGAGASWSYDPAKCLMISYDTVPMVEEKTEYVVSHGLGGTVWWEASGDRGGRNGTKSDGSLISTFVDSVKAFGGELEKSENVLNYPESRYENMQRGFSS
ncbi:Chitinase 4 [Emydomyces testavorans]|uniref:chitinase n=1 Tax=Emydomyces testavorans TaxID=2070801 RepID=A0AAF0DLM1_9EURO|nr:Chitinase 4 [Emydomyces testavorans]